MSYCTPQWLSDFTYRAIYDDARRHGALQVEPTLDGLLVRLAFDGYGMPSLAPVYQLSHVAISGVGPGEYSAELFDASGVLLASYPLEVRQVQQEAPMSLAPDGTAQYTQSEPTLVPAIVAVVPLPERPVARIRITRNGASVAEQALAGPGLRAANTATLNHTGEGALLRWTPAELPALVRFSADGQHWTTLAVDASGGRLRIDPQLLSAPYVFEIIPAGQAKLTVSSV
jgi:hypothetical protein